MGYPDRAKSTNLGVEAGMKSRFNDGGRSMIIWIQVFPGF